MLHYLLCSAMKNRILPDRQKHKSKHCNLNVLSLNKLILYCRPAKVVVSGTFFVKILEGIFKIRTFMSTAKPNEHVRMLQLVLGELPVESVLQEKTKVAQNQVMTLCEIYKFMNFYAISQTFK